MPDKPSQTMVSCEETPQRAQADDDGRGRRGPEYQIHDCGLDQDGVDRIHAGEGYYRAAGDELRGRGYPTRSVFNWRTPLPMWLIGRMPASLNRCRIQKGEGATLTPVTTAAV